MRIYSLQTKITVSGVPYDEAMEYLSNLSLEQAARDLRLSELGRRIRHMLIKPFRMASVTGDPEGAISAGERGGKTGIENSGLGGYTLIGKR